MPAFEDGLAETEVLEGTTVQTDVLVVGSGPAGGAAALCLSTLGIPNIMITKYRWTATKYLIGTDGARSLVAEHIGLAPMTPLPMDWLMW
jgi:2-polyprenyl-6-methoxyphenol hydroxylase-like FAD-dependent oxidoreductase